MTIETKACTKLATLSGETYPIREILVRQGWEWNAADKSWSQVMDSATTSDRVFGKLRSAQGGKMRVRLHLEFSEIGEDEGNE